MALLHLIGHWLGISDEAGAGYAFWSGIGSDLGLIAGAGIFLRHKNCHQRGCWRLGKHAVQNTPYVVCAKHHPDVPDGGATAAHITHQAATAHP